MLTALAVREHTAVSPFVTLDDCVPLAQILADRLKRLGQQKYPLSVRRGSQLRSRERGRPPAPSSSTPRQLRAGTRTYFFDIETASDGRRFLKITESRFLGSGTGRERQSILIFPETASAFLQMVSAMTTNLS